MSCQRAGLQGPVQRARGPAFALHLDDVGTVPQMLLAFLAHWSAHSPIGEDGVIG